jgi:hypothetical protein
MPERPPGGVAPATAGAEAARSPEATAAFDALARLGPAARQSDAAGDEAKLTDPDDFTGSCCRTAARRAPPLKRRRPPGGVLHLPLSPRGRCEPPYSDSPGWSATAEEETPA